MFDFVVTNRLWDNAARMGNYFKSGLVKLWNDNPGIIKEVRGLGLMIGIEYQYEFVGALMAECLSQPRYLGRIFRQCTPGDAFSGAI